MSTFTSRRVKDRARTPVGSSAELEAALQIVRGVSAPYERFSYAWSLARIRLGTLRAFARLLGVHPSALTRSNFKVSRARQRQACDLLEVPEGFLATRMRFPEALPVPLKRLRGTLHAVLELANRPERTGTAAAWAAEATLAQMSTQSVVAALPECDQDQVAAVHRHLTKRAAQALQRRVAIELPLTDWCLTLDLLVGAAIAHAPGDLNDRRLQLARRLHRDLRSAATPP